MICRTPEQAEAYIRSLNTNWRPQVIEAYKPRRSTFQNSRLWWLHGLTAQRLNQVLAEEFAETQSPVVLAAMRSPWTPESVHQRIYKPQFLNGESSTKRNKMETVDDQTAYEAWMVDIGIEFPETERYE